MDHRIIKHNAVPLAAVWGLLLGSLVPARVAAQDAMPQDAPAAIAAVHPPAGLSTAARHRAARARVSASEDGADDPESHPVPAYDLPRAGARAADPAGLAISVVGKTGLVVALILVCAAGWQRLRGAAPLAGLAPVQAVQVASTVSIGPQRFLHLVTVGRHQLLVGSSPQNVSLIAVLEGGSRSDAEDESVAVPHAPLARGAAAEDGNWAPEREAPADRFEELLLRLRDLESGPPGGAPTGSRMGPVREPARREVERDAPRRDWELAEGALRPPGPRYERDSGQRDGAALEPGWMGRAGGESAAPAFSEEPGRALSPGKLFKTSSGSGTGASRRQEGIDA